MLVADSILKGKFLFSMCITLLAMASNSLVSLPRCVSGIPCILNIWELVNNFLGHFKHVHTRAHALHTHAHARARAHTHARTHTLTLHSNKSTRSRKCKDIKTLLYGKKLIWHKNFNCAKKCTIKKCFAQKMHCTKMHCAKNALRKKCIEQKIYCAKSHCAELGMITRVIYVVFVLKPFFSDKWKKSNKLVTP